MKELLYLKDDQLKDLIEKLFIGYRETFSDSKKIFKEIFEVQKKRIYNALLNSSSEEVINFDNVLKKIINE